MLKAVDDGDPRADGRQGAVDDVTSGYVDANRAVKTPQFWLLWVMLCMNVSCGIGIINQVRPNPLHGDHLVLTPCTSAGGASRGPRAETAGRIRSFDAKSRQQESADVPPLATSRSR
jgi:hypothetical protein